ncbi:MAG: hypothetical protein AAFZ11_08305, partial [Pseudomonadota bacterium]
MKIFSTTKLRAIGSVSAIAVTAGLGTTSAAQDMAPAPVDEVPTPMVPMAPADAVECALDAVAMPNTVVCAPGTDADGITEALDDVVLTVEAGAQVQGEINLGANTIATIDGDFVVDSITDGALELGEGSTVVNNGFIGGDADFDGFVVTGDNSTVTNNGTVFNDGSTGGIGFNVGNGSTFTNNGLIAMQGNNVFGVLGQNLTVSGNNVTVVNSQTGSIIVDGQGNLSANLSAAIRLGDDATVTNDGLIQTFGGIAEGILTFARGTITNNGNIQTSANGAEGISTGEDSTVINTGSVATLGDNLSTILVGDNSTLNNSGTITAAGEDADAVTGGDMFTLTNSGMITASGEGARGVEAGDDFTLVNSGTIEAHDRAINAGDDATITNEVGGLINSTGDGDDTTEDADTIQTGDNLTIVNNGTISNEGFDTKIIDAGDNLTVTNNGLITSDWKGVEGEANFTLTNNAGALIFSTNDEAVEADDAGLVVVNDGDIIAPKDDAVDGGADVTITNTGLIRGGENDAIELDSGIITNSGIIESLSSDPEGDFSDADLTNRELDAGIDFDGVDDPNNLAGPEADTVINLEGGIIRGDIGINASSGNFVDDGEGGSEAGSPANVRSQVVANFGLIQANTGNPVNDGRLDAVL